MRRAARTDSTHKSIKEHLRASGYRVFDTAKFGDGFPDLVVVTKTGRVAIFFENKAEGEGEVTRDECKFMMQIVEPVYRIVWNGEQAGAVMAAIEMQEKR